MVTLISPLRDSNAYVGISKQAVGGTAVAPSTFIRWLDSTSMGIEVASEEIVEGDTTRHVAFFIKNKQETKIKIVTYIRPILAGMLEAASMGTVSDNITDQTPSTTTNTVVTGGSSTTVGITSNTGFTSAGGGTFQLILGTGTSNDPYETVTFSVPTSGTTLTVASSYNGGVFKSSHPSGTTISSVAVVNTSLTNAPTAGATSFQTGKNTGLTSGGTQSVVLSPGTVNEEIVTVTVPGTGTGPYTYTIANSGTLKYSHSIGDAVLQPVNHVIEDTNDGDYYTVEMNFGGTNGITIRVRDCKVDQIKRSADSGKLLKVEIDLVGIACAVQATPSTVTLEAHQPFLFTQSNGGWTLDGSTTGDALNIQKFDITTKNNLDMVQTEAVIYAASIFGKLQIEVSLDVIYTNNTKIGQAFFGAVGGTADAQSFVLGSCTILFTQADGMHTLQYSIPTLTYHKVALPVPKGDGKAFVQPITAGGSSNNGSNAYVLQTTVANFQTASY